LFDRAADEIEKWRDAYRKAVQTPAAELMVVGPGWHERFPVITAPIVIDGLLQVHVSDRRDDMADELTRLRAENAALIAERAAPVQPVQAPMTERERRAPARREEMAAFAAELKADPVKAQRFFHEAGILDAQGNLTPQYGGREQALPDGWVPLVVTLPDSHPEEVAYGPKVMMDRLGKWLAKHFAAVQAQGEPVAWRIFDGEGNYDYRDDPPDEFNVSWSARYGRKYQPLYLHPPRADAEVK